MPIQTICAGCGKPIYKKPTQIKQKNFCSSVCFFRWNVGENNAAFKGGQVAHNCASCDKIIFRYPGWRGKNAYCSVRCQMIWEKQHVAKNNHPNWRGHTIVCEECGTESQRSASLIKGRKHHFCNMECRGRWLARVSEFAYKKDANHDEIVSDLRKLGCYVCETHRMGAGFPDILVIHDTGVYLFEIKNPKSNHKLTKAQIKWHSGWRGQVAVVTSAEDALRLFGASANQRHDPLRKAKKAV